MAEIYLVTNSVNGKKYVGKTNGQSKDRWRYHLSLAKNGSSCAIHRAIRKYGQGSFIIEPIEVCPEYDLSDREIFHILRLNTLLPNGYNMTKGGDGAAATIEVRKKISEKLTGRHLSLETKAKVSSSLTGSHLSTKTKEKLSKAALGRAHTEESKKKISETKKKKFKKKLLIHEKRRYTRKDFCGRNHPFDEVNTYISPSTGARSCLTCWYINKKLKIPERLLCYLTTPVV